MTLVNPGRINLWKNTGFACTILPGPADMAEKRKTKRPGARQMAAAALYRVEAHDAFSEIALDKIFTAHNPRPADRALATEITYGVLRWKLLLDFHLRRAADRPLEKIERQALIALRIGAYQLLMLDRVPAPAAVNESVSTAPPRARGFVNAVLRNLASNREGLKDPGQIPDQVERISITQSHPRWMVEQWVGQIGEEAAAELCRANNLRPPLSLRVNTLRTGREALLRLLQREGVPATPGKWSPLAVTVETATPVTSLPGYHDGLFAIQDQASQLVPLVLAPRPGELIMDACAAPGTKSLEIMQLLGGQGRVVAVDIHKGRLKRMAAEARRLGLSNVTRVEADASAPIELPQRFRDRLFDRVLVDAPCTGLGTIRRSPEIKQRRKPEDVRSRAELQRKILDNVSRLLKPGGVLVYSTCTFTVEENEWAVAPLLHSGQYQQEDPARFLPAAASLVENRMLRTWPHLTGTDGFTVFRLRKKNQ